MSTRHSVGVGLRRAWVLGIASATMMVAGAEAALAQDQQREGAGDALQEVVITGWPISRPEVEAATPTVVVSSEVFEARGIESYEAELFGTQLTQFYLGVSNAFDKEPPFFATSSSGTQALDTIPGYYDVFGRSYFAGLKVRL